MSVSVSITAGTPANAASGGAAANGNALKGAETSLEAGFGALLALLGVPGKADVDLGAPGSRSAAIDINVPLPAGLSLDLSAEGELPGLLGDLKSALSDLLGDGTTASGSDKPDLDPDLLAGLVELLNAFAAPQPTGTGTGGQSTDAPKPQAPNLTDLIGKLTELSQKLSETQPEQARALAALGQKIEALSGADKAAFAALLGQAPVNPPRPTQSAPQSAPQTTAAPAEAIAPAASTSQALPADTAEGSDGPAPHQQQAEAAPKSPTDPDARPERLANSDGDAKTRPDVARPPAGGDAAATQPASATPSPDGTNPAAAADIRPVGAQAPAQVQQLASPYRPQTINMPHITYEISRHIEAGQSRFEIRLDPPEMGRIDVRLEMADNGNVNARLTVERAETLDLLQRDARALERALAQAGSEGDKTNLEFSLRQNPFGQHMQDGNRQQPGAGWPSADAAPLETVAEPAPIIYRGTARPGGVNMTV